MNPEPRRHDLDALRALAMLLGVVLHAGMSFMPAPWPVQDSDRHWQYGLLFSAIHGFRMPLFFLISGFFTTMLWQRRGAVGLLKHRFQRIVLPLLLGMVTVVPAMNLALQQATPWTAQQERLATVMRGGRDAALRVLEAEGLQKQGGPDSRLSLLQVATMFGSLEVVEKLLDAGASAGARGGDLGTPLHLACLLGRDEIAVRLLASGADPEARNMMGRTPADLLALDGETTRLLSKVLGLPLNLEKAMAGRRKIAALLQVPEPDFAGADGSWGKLRRLLDEPIFHHLWFLWFLVWMVAGFLAVVLILGRLKMRWIPKRLLLGSCRYLWLIPLTTCFQYPMGRTLPVLGPDASMALLPPVHLLGYYGVFFGYGAWMRLAGEESKHLGIRWKSGLFMTVLLFVLGMAATYQPGGNHLIASVLKVSYAWCACFTALGVCRRFLPRPGTLMRYLAESSYWIYVAHLPLLLPLQAWVAPWELSSILKFPLLCLLTTGSLLLVYHFLVRRTWLGRLLNGRLKAVD